MPEDRFLTGALAVRSTKSMRPLPQKLMNRIDGAKFDSVEEAVRAVFVIESDLGLKMLVEQVERWLEREERSRPLPPAPPDRPIGRPRKEATA